MTKRNRPRRDPRVGAWLHQEDARLAGLIRAHGWAIQYVMGDEARQRTPIAYTVGLFGMGHPELVFLGGCTHDASGVLNDVGSRVKAGEQFLPGMLISFDSWPHRLTVEEVPNPAAILFSANRHYRRSDEASVPALQLTHDDTEGRFPWDAGYSIPAWIQPRPGTYTA